MKKIKTSEKIVADVSELEIVAKSFGEVVEYFDDRAAIEQDKEKLMRLKTLSGTLRYAYKLVLKELGRDIVFVNGKLVV